MTALWSIPNMVRHPNPLVDRSSLYGKGRIQMDCARDGGGGIGYCIFEE